MRSDATLADRLCFAAFNRMRINDLNILRRLLLALLAGLAPAWLPAAPAAHVREADAAFAAAAAERTGDEVVVVAGSLYLVAAVRALLLAAPAVPVDQPAPQAARQGG